METLLKPKVAYSWQDITSDFQDSCSVLKVDELVHDKMFGLFEAMSAIEIMDPKMDAGMVCKNTEREIVQFKDAVSSGKLKVSSFQPDELLGIMDELLACFVTWLDGHSLIQTVFICLYTHDTNLIEDPVLRAICISVLKLVDVIRNIIARAKVYEEEDFQTLSYGFKLGSDVTELRISGMLREAEEEISRQIKARMADQEVVDDRIKALNGIKIRLKIWRAFYCALITFEKPDITEISKAKEWLASASKLVPDAYKSIDLGLEMSKKEEPTSEYTMLGFDSLVNHRLLPPSFPREINIIGRQQAYTYAKDLIQRLLRVTGILECTNFHSILEFVSDFSQQCPCVLSRSVLQLIVYHSGRVFGKLQMPEMLKEMIKNFNSSPVLADMSPLSASQEAKDIATSFVAKASMVMLSLMHGHGHNRARQRERLADSLEELGNLQEEADKADSDLNRILLGIDKKTTRQHLACFGSWVLYHTLKVMIEYILLGFELELFSPHEFHYVYWYLDFLFGWGINCLSRAERLVVIQEQYIDKKCGKKEKKRKKELISACQESVKGHQCLKSLFIGIKCLCLGIVKSCEGFDKDKKVQRPQPELDNEQVRFEHRFAAFACIDTPQPVTYFQYKEATDPLFSTDNGSSSLYQEAQKYFERAVATFERFEEKSSEVDSLLKVAKTNFIVMKLASSGHKQDSKNLVDWDFNVHRSFPIIKLL